MATLKAAAKNGKAAAMSDDELLAKLAELADQIDAANTERDRLYAERKALFVEGRRRVPPIGTRILGNAARVSDVLITQQTAGAAKATKR